MEWLEEERDERQKQRDMLKRDIQKAVEGIDERFVSFTHQIKDKLVHTSISLLEILIQQMLHQFKIDEIYLYLIYLNYVMSCESHYSGSNKVRNT